MNVEIMHWDLRLSDVVKFKNVAKKSLLLKQHELYFQIS
jgi:hypothetical protein